VITVSAAAAGGELVVTVTDNGNGPPASLDGVEMKVGVGLGSTCERLARMFPDRHSFSMRRMPEGGTEVRLTLPFRVAAVEGRREHHEQPALADR
jgi:LytS/YehU family sensor histidine kinase